MDNFLVGALAGILLGMLLVGSRRAVDAALADLAEPAAEAPKLEAAAEMDAEEYEDPGKRERGEQLEMYRRLLREEFGLDQAGSLAEPLTGEEAATHG